MLKVTRTAPEALATDQASDALVARLRAYPQFFDAELLAELRGLLRRYPARAIARHLEAVVDELVAEGRGPTWPDDGEADVVVQLVLGLHALPTHHLARQAASLRQLQQSA